MTARKELAEARHYVYRHYDANGQILYVGCAMDVEARFRQHMYERTWWAQRVARTKVTVHPNRAEGLRVEKAEIRRLEPIHNVEKWWMDTAAWDTETWVRHGRAIAETPHFAATTPQGAAGRLYVRYQRQHGGDLFDLIGPVQPGFRQYDRELPGRPRSLTFRPA